MSDMLHFLIGYVLYIPFCRLIDRFLPIIPGEEELIARIALKILRWF